MKAIRARYDGLKRSPFDEAEFEGALESDPLSPVVRLWIGLMCLLDVQYDRAIDVARDKKGRITGYVVESGRVRHLKFTRVQ